MADVSVRPATLADVADIGRIQVATWRTGYANVLPAEVLESLSEAEASRAWQAAVGEPPTPSHRVLVALEGRQAVGFVAVAPAADADLEMGEGPEPSGDLPGRDGAVTVVVHSLLVEPRWGRRGHGSRLLAAAIDTAREDGSTQALTWVLEADDTSRGFFGSAGWAADGVARILDTGPTTLRELRLHTDIS